MFQRVHTWCTHDHVYITCCVHFGGAIYVQPVDGTRVLHGWLYWFYADYARLLVTTDAGTESMHGRILPCSVWMQWSWLAPENNRHTGLNCAWHMLAVRCAALCWQVLGTLMRAAILSARLGVTLPPTGWVLSSSSKQLPDTYQCPLVVWVLSVWVCSWCRVLYSCCNTWGKSYLRHDWCYVMG